MRHLLAKDVRLVAPYLWLIVPAHVLWCVQAFLSPRFYFGMSLAAALSWTGAITMIEWHADAGRVIASLPVTRTTTVHARYASSLGGVALGTVLYVLYGYGALAVASGDVVERWHRAAVLLSINGVLGFAGLGCLLVVVFLPFLFRFGLPLGASLFSASAAVTVFAAMGLSHALGLQWSLSGASSIGWPAWLVAVTIAVALGVLSTWLSVRFYERRDL